MENWNYMAYIFAIIGIAEILFFIHILLQSKKTKEWKTVKGQLNLMDVNKINSSVEDGFSKYKLKASYKYTVDNIEYNSKRVFYGDFIFIDTSSAFKKMIQKYTAKSEVNVYYDSRNPARSVLEPGINLIIYRMLLLGTITIIVSVFLLLN